MDPMKKQFHDFVYNTTNVQQYWDACNLGPLPPIEEMLRKDRENPEIMDGLLRNQIAACIFIGHYAKAEEIMRCLERRIRDREMLQKQK